MTSVPKDIWLMLSQPYSNLAKRNKKRFPSIIPGGPKRLKES